MNYIALLALIFVSLSGAISAQSMNSKAVTFQGICDASAVVGIGGNLVAVANDEDNIIRVYSAEGGPPLGQTDFSGFLQVDPKEPEADIEAAAMLGDRIFWITSHGRNSKGKARSSRSRVFATMLAEAGGVGRLEAVGKPYSRLLEDLVSDPRLNDFKLGEASTLPPKAPGGLNIEGMVATPEGALLIGFRNPVPRGKALIVPLTNPQGLLAGERAQFAPPILLDLGGLGIRSMELVDERYLMVAGSYKEGGESRLFEWHGGESGAVMLHLETKGFNAEGIARLQYQDGSRLLIISDDGNRKIGGKPCKNLKDPTNKMFDGLLISPIPTATKHQR